MTDSAEIHQLRHGYYASISFVDAQIGKVIDELDRLGLRENTIIILWGDHGFHLGEQGLWAKSTNFVLDTRVPLVISNSDQIKQGVKSNGFVELVDVYPTLVDLVGMPIPPGLEGISMAPLIKEPKRSWKSGAFSQFLRFDQDKNQIKGIPFAQVIGDIQSGKWWKRVKCSPMNCTITRRTLMNP